MRKSGLAIAMGMALGLVLAEIPGGEARAAQGAVVDVNSLEVRRGPGSKYDVLVKLKKGTPVVASSYPTEGYFKIRTAKGEVGWVKADSLILYPKKDLDQNAGSTAD